MNFLSIKKYLLGKDILLKTSLSENQLISGLSSLTKSKSSEITFYADEKLIHNLKNTNAIACLIKEEHKIYLPSTCHPIIVNNPYLAFAHITNFFYPHKLSNNSKSEYYFINKNSKIGNNVQIGNFVSINDKVTIGNNVVLSDNISLGLNTVIGSNTIIDSGCFISNSIIGSNCHIQSGTVIGDKGFGFTPKEKIEMRHIGNVIIGNNVQIGSNVNIDRAALESTIINDNVRIDNLVHIAHNVTIGEGTIIAAQCGFAGSAVIGKNCIFGGQVGIAGHINIGDNVIVAAKSGVTKNIIDNSTIAGYPAIDINKWKRSIINKYKNI